MKSIITNSCFTIFRLVAPTICVIFLATSQSESADYPILKGKSDQQKLAVYKYGGPVSVKVGEVSFAWTSKKLIVSGKATDKRMITPNVAPEGYSEGYKYDSVELWVGGKQYCAGLTANGAALWSFTAKTPSPQGNVEITQTPKGYDFTIEIPWSELGISPAPGTKIKLAFGINNHDKIGDKGTQTYIPGDYVWGDSSTFASCVLAERYDNKKHTRKFAKEACAFSYPNEKAMEKITATLNTSKRLGKVNKKLFGVCAHKPPWSEALIQAVKPFLENGSVRVWARGNKKWDTQWGELLKETNPKWSLGFTDKCWHPKPVRYASTSDNNLFDYQQPAKTLNRLIYALKLAKVKLDAYEIWNEPEFKVNGAWPPMDMSRYVADCSKAIKKRFPEMQIGAFLCDSAWNRSFLKSLPKGAVDFVDHHYYNTFWFHVGYSGATAYSGKVVYTPQLRKRIISDLNDIKCASPKQISLICSEWGVHPKTYKAPYGVCHDIGAVIYHASAILAFMDLGLQSAQFFKLSEPSAKLTHFRLINPEHPRSGIGNLLLFQAFGRLFKGERVALALTAPSLTVSGVESKNHPPSLTAPVTEGAAALWNDGKHLCVMLINKHLKTKATIALKGLDGKWIFEKGTLIHSEEIDSVDISADAFPVHSKNSLWSIPPRSILFALLRKKQ
jgi:hypothetical protein